MNIQQINSSLAAMTTHYTKAQGQKELLETSLSLDEEKLEELDSSIMRGELVQALFTKTSEYARAQLKRRIEATVTAGIQAIFQDDDEFMVKMGEFRGQAAADWRVKVNGTATVNGMVVPYGGVVDPEEADGGGLTNAVSTALRLSVLETSRPKLGGALFLDEPTHFVSGESSGSEFVLNMTIFLKEYAKNTSRQLFLVTHHNELKNIADASYSVVRGADRISEVRRNG